MYESQEERDSKGGLIVYGLNTEGTDKRVVVLVSKNLRPTHFFTSLLTFSGSINYVFFESGLLNQSSQESDRCSLQGPSDTRFSLTQEETDSSLSDFRYLVLRVD